MTNTLKSNTDSVDKKTNLNIVDSSGNVVGSVGGRIGSDAEEVANAKTLANESLFVSTFFLAIYFSPMKISHQMLD